jgi:hypothetical protein
MNLDDTPKETVNIQTIHIEILKIDVCVQAMIKCHFAFDNASALFVKSDKSSRLHEVPSKPLQPFRVVFCPPLY